MKKRMMVIGLVLAAAMTVRADFTLVGTDQMTVDWSTYWAYLHDQSRVEVVPGGFVDDLRTWDSSTATVSGGSVYCLYAYNSSTATVSGGSVRFLEALDSSTATVSGGSVEFLEANNLRSSGGIHVNLSGGTVGTLRASLTLVGSESMNIDAAPTATSLKSYGVDINGGTVNNMSWGTLSAYDSSTATISGGSVEGLNTYGSSTATVSDGSVGRLYTYGSSTATVSDGSLGYLYAWDSSTVTIAGGGVDKLYALNSGTVTFNATNFIYGRGLTLDGNRVLGTGVLSGKWFDGTPWSANIVQNDSTATILAVPEPMTLGLFLLGGPAILRRRKA